MVGMQAAAVEISEASYSDSNNDSRDFSFELVEDDDKVDEFFLDL